MNLDTHAPLTDDECHALVDAQGTPVALDALRLRLQDDPDAQQQLAQWQTQRDSLRRLHADVLHESLPSALLQATRQASAARQTSTQWRHLGGVAASVLLAFGVGWLSNSGWQAARSHSVAAPQLAQAKFESDFVHQASLAHSVYTPEVKHPVEVTAQEQAHLVQWLSKRLGKPLKVPNLSVQGFELVGGRLLPGDAGARAQFMFQNAAALRVTLYLGALNPGSAQGRSSQETSFRFEPQAGVPSFYWVDQGFGYALAGQLPREQLMQLADAVYRQL
ncbi:MAG: anti-sigma factor [Rhodoferax sp.]|nr:anti-sigma factor [Rhodoferax sp.]